MITIFPTYLFIWRKGTFVQSLSALTSNFFLMYCLFIYMILLGLFLVFSLMIYVVISLNISAGVFYSQVVCRTHQHTFYFYCLVWYQSTVTFLGCRQISSYILGCRAPLFHHGYKYSLLCHGCVYITWYSRESGPWVIISRPTGKFQTHWLGHKVVHIVTRNIKK